jgi:hypothetical protein
MACFEVHYLSGKREIGNTRIKGGLGIDDKKQLCMNRCVCLEGLASRLRRTNRKSNRGMHILMTMKLFV